MMAQDLVITAAYDGPLSGGTPKGIELYVINDIPDLSIYGVGSANNGGGTDGEEYTFPADAVTAGTYIYVSSEDVNFPSFFGFPTTYNAGSAMGVNGDDAVELFQSGAVIDTFGDINTDGTGQPWEYLDGWAYRVDGTGPDGATFTLANWTFSGPNALDGETTNGTAATPVPVGTYSTMPPTDPTITVSGAVSGLDYFEGFGPSGEGTFTVSGINLTADINLAAPADFEISTTSGSGFTNAIALTPSSGTVNTTTIYARLQAGLTPAAYSGDVTASSTGAMNETVSLSGTVSPSNPQITISGSVGDLNYTSGAGPSPEDSFFVEGIFLTTDITVTAPANFEVSLTSGSGFTNAVIVTQTGGTAASTEVFVRLAAGLADGNYMGDITASSTGATDQTLGLNGNVFGPPTNSLVITGVIDGPLSGGTPKAVELYALDNIADISAFGISSITNGAGSSAGTIEYSFPAGAVAAGTFLYLTTDAAQFDAFFGFMPDYTNGVISVNGDDSLELYENGQIIDTFGDVNMDGTGMPWEYLDGWAYRVDDSGPDGGSFVLANWTFSGPNALDGETLNSTAVTPFPIGTYMNALSVEDFERAEFTLFPNPNRTGILNIQSSFNGSVDVEIYDILGKQVMTRQTVNNNLNVSNLNSGVYIVKLSQGDAVTTKKLIIE